MAKYSVGPGNSYQGTGIASQVGPGIDPGEVDGKLTVKSNGFLISTNHYGARLTGSWTINVLGRLGTESGDVEGGLFLGTSGPLLKSSVTVDAKGEIFSLDTAAIFSRHPVNIVNKGKIVGDDYGVREVTDGNYKIVNHGLIKGVSPIFSDGVGVHTIINAGKIEVAGGSLGRGTNNITNYGTIQGNVQVGDGSDFFVNYKKVGNTIKHGVVTGLINLGAGDDTFKGGNKAETILAGPGEDKYYLGGGKDTYIAYSSGIGGTDADDTIIGGKGIDTYDASRGTAKVVVNLDTKAHDRGPLNPGQDALAANSAKGSQISGDLFRDKIFNFENVKGSSDDDTIYGSKAANKLEGNAGNDYLFGFGGNDTLIGGIGTDRILGSAGKDILWGGNENTGDDYTDFFVFTSIKDSGPTAKTRDIIMDFAVPNDLIDLTLIDAKPKTPFNDPFKLIGTDVPFTKTAGDLRVLDLGGNKYIVQADVTGDGKADFSIEVRGVVGISWSIDVFLGVI